MTRPTFGQSEIREIHVNPKTPPKHRSVGKWFVKGPIPGDWLVRASKVSGRALRVGLALWFLVGFKRSRIVKPTWDTWRRFGLCPDSGSRGLAALENAGLIKVERASGKCPVVTICESEGKESENGF